MSLPIGGTDPFAGVAVEEHALTLVAPSPIRLLTSATVAEYCRIMATLAGVVRQMISGADSLARITVEEHALALVAPSPVTLLSYRILAKQSGIPAALTWIMRQVIGRADAFARIVAEEHTLAFVAPPPTGLLTAATIKNVNLAPRRRIADNSRMLTAVRNRIGRLPAQWGFAACGHYLDRRHCRRRAKARSNVESLSQPK